jgi:hypothetical protein
LGVINDMGYHSLDELTIVLNFQQLFAIDLEDG